MSLALENEARGAYEAIAASSRPEMGGCVAALPMAEELHDYMAKLRDAWVSGWCNKPARYPHLLLRLYHCVAFLHYEGNAFWASFAAAVGDERIASGPHRQTEINNIFAHIAHHLGLGVIEGRDGSRLCVQSAVRHVGIPVRVWRGFVEVCERLFYAEDDWAQWTDDRWKDALGLWLGGRRNLLTFFVENRSTATQWVRELLDARRILQKQTDWTLDDIARLSRLRSEYFDEVPESAAFLRPTDPESLFRDRPRLRLSEHQGGVSLYLETPRVKSETQLPAKWRVLSYNVQASTNPRTIPLHRDAFSEDLQLKLVRGEAEVSHYRLRGLNPWGLWCESTGAFISTQAHELSVGGYALISKTPLNFANRDGWLEDDEDETRWNVETAMPDGSVCFVSRLVPAPESRRAVLEVEGWHRMTFAPRSRIELRLYPRPTEHFHFAFASDQAVQFPNWPWFVLKVPKGLLQRTATETEEFLQADFHLMSGLQPVAGKWSHLEDVQCSEDDEVFLFRVSERQRFPPHAQPTRPARVLHDLRDLDLSKATKPTPIPVERFSLQMRSQRFGVIPFDKAPEVHLENLPPLPPAHSQKLSIRFKDYLPWFILTATHERAQWEEIRLAFDMMNMTGAQLAYYDFRVVEQHGMMVRRGHRWTDFENRIHFGRHQGGGYTVRYAGLTTAIYTVLRQFEPLEKVVARWERGHPPHLEMRFSLQGNTDPRLREACQRAGIRVMKDSLWTH